MSWVTIIWSMVASACLTLATVHLLIWFQKRTAWTTLLFALTASATAGLAFCELWAMRAESVGEYGMVLRWGHMPFWVLVISLVGFARLYMRAGRVWIAWTVCGLRTLSLILNFAFTPNLNYREITALRHVPFLGESVAVAEGIPNPWMLVGQTSLLLFLVFLVDVAVTLWRRGERGSMLMLSMAMLLFIATGTGQFVLAFWGIGVTPLTPSLFFLGVVGAMAYELSRDTIRAAQLSAGLQRSQQQLQAILDGAPSLVYVKNTQGRFTLVNRRFESVFGLQRETLIGKTSHDLLPKQIEDARHAADLDVMTRREAIFTEEALDEPEGRHTYFSVKFPLFDSAGKLYAVCGISTDITKHKQAELELQQRRAELAHLSRVTTLSELSGSLAHELNQPLAIILTNAQAAQRLLARQPPDLAEAREILADIVSEDERAGEVIKRLRALLKPGETLLQPLSVSELVEDVLRIARSDLIARGITVHTSIAEPLPQTVGDRIQLQQVLLNLMLNAAEAMAANPPSGRHLTVTTAYREGAVRISVSDTGRGLPQEAERVFEPFYTTKKDGLGLGLAICRSIVAAHNGRLWAQANVAAGVPPGDSSVGHGATFPTDTQPVFEAIIDNAVRLCDGQSGGLQLYDGGHLRLGASRGNSPEYAKWLAENPNPPALASGARSRLIAEQQPIHILDRREFLGYREGDP
jgi:two-component system, LuxR family, sensor kinase FixL